MSVADVVGAGLGQQIVMEMAVLAALQYAKQIMAIIWTSHATVVNHQLLLEEEY
jgi:hypothetical protein